MTTTPTPIASMTLVEITERQKILAGHDRDTEAVFVLRKTDAGEWFLYRIPISELDQQLRSFVSASESESLELAKAIRETIRPRRQGRRAG